MTPTPRSARPGARSTSAPSLPPGGPAAGSPRGSSASQTRPFHSRSHQRPRLAPDVARPGAPGAGDGSGRRFGRSRSPPRRWVRGGAAAMAASPPGQRPGGGREGPVRGRPRAGSVVGPRRVFDNPVVGHASISNSRVCVVVARINLSTNARGDVGPSLSREGTRRPAVEGMGGPHASHDAAGRGTDGRFALASRRSTSATGALGLRVGEAVGSAWSSPQGHGVDA